MDIKETLGDIERAIKGRERVLAVEQIKHLLQQNAQLGTSWSTVGKMALGLGESQLAVDAADKLRRQNEPTLAREVDAAGLLAEAGALPVAMALAEQYLTQFPDNPSLLHLCGTVAAQLNHQQKAVSYLTKVVGLQPQVGISWLTLAPLINFAEQTTLFEQLQQAKAHFDERQGINYMHYQYTMGKALVDRQEYDDAMEHYKKGAQVMQQASRYDPQMDERICVDIIRNYEGISYKRIPRGRVTNESTIAILGLPRSGTTLLGQMLAKHDEISVTSEAGEFGHACRHLAAKQLANFPAFIHTHGAPQSAVDLIAETYKHLLTSRHGQQGMIVDKSLNLNRLFGIWAKAVPQGKAIYIHRDPEHVAWSCFKSPFRGGADWSWSKQNITSYLKHEQMLIEHWRTLFPERILAVEYEQVIANAQRVMTQISEFVGLKPQQQTFSPENSLNPVTTSSLGQVDKPLSRIFQQVADQMVKRF